MKKILYFIDRLDIVGGVQRVLSLKANYLVEKLNHQVQIAVFQNDENKPSFFRLNDSIRIYNLDIDLRRYMRKLHEVKIKELIDLVKPDICITLMCSEVFFLHKIEDGSKKIAEFHISKQSMVIQIEESRLAFLKKLYRKFLTSNLFRFVRKYDRFIPLNREERLSRAIIKYDFFITLTYEDKKDWGSLKNSRVIPNPITFSIKNKLPDYDSKTVLSVGRIVYQKGFEYLVKVWKIVHSKYPDWQLIILGRCDNDDTLDNYIKKQELNEVISVLPATPNVEQYYQKSSIYTATSRYEGFPMTLLEAAAFGLPIVTWKCPTGPAEIINHQEDGLLSEYMNIEELADNLMKLMADENKRQQYGKAAQKNIQRFSMENIMKQWDDLFKELYN